MGTLPRWGEKKEEVIPEERKRQHRLGRHQCEFATTLGQNSLEESNIYPWSSTSALISMLTKLLPLPAAVADSKSGEMCQLCQRQADMLRKKPASRLKRSPNESFLTPAFHPFPSQNRAMSFLSVTDGDSGTRCTVGTEPFTAPSALPCPSLPALLAKSYHNLLCCHVPNRAEPDQPRSRPAPAVPAAPALLRSSLTSPASAAAAVALRALWPQSAIDAMAELPLPAGLSASTFPAKLWRLVNSPRIHSVRWDSRAQGLLIDRSLFEQELLSSGHAHGAGAEGAGPAPDSFQATHFGSFVRQLNLYGFRKVPGWVGSDEPSDAGGWLHFRNPNFRRDRPDLLLHIKRLTRANKQRLAAGLEVRSRQPSRFQQLHTERAVPSFPAGQPPRAVLSYQDLAAASSEGLELLPGHSRLSAGAQEADIFLRSPKKIFATSGFLGISSQQPDTGKFQFSHELIVPLVPVDHHNPSMTSPERSSCTSSEQQLPARSPSARPGTSALSTPAGSAGFAAWTAPSWLWNTPGEEELPPPDLDMVLETLEEMFSPSAQGNINVAPESSGGEPVDRAAAKGAVPGTESCRNNSQEPKELDIHLIYLSRRAALREKKNQTGEPVAIGQVESLHLYIDL